MSLKLLLIPPVPEEVARVAHAVFPKGNVFMQIRDTLGTIYTDEAFADLFPTHGQPAFAPWRLALATIFQFMEGLTDRQAADAVRDRLAWKYARAPGVNRCRIRSYSPFRMRAHALLRVRPNSVCWTCSWSGVGRVDG